MSESTPSNVCYRHLHPQRFSRRLIRLQSVFRNVINMFAALISLCQSAAISAAVHESSHVKQRYIKYPDLYLSGPR